ncbi:hypothetical protein [Methylobacterium flocculans]|uniref:hypothetical protein n=1 Tax=Methylobacterium flocculans TaxID=2984843 RepID=UPI0021F2D7D2|nr:hypothetical protein [Methylobacterium sp. FF17]
MADQAKPFDLEAAESADLQPGGTYLLPLCMVRPEIMLGEEVAIVLLNTSNGVQIGVPLTHQSVERLHGLFSKMLHKTKIDRNTTY